MNWKYLGWTTIIGGGLIGGGCLIGNMDYSTGSRRGTVVKLSERGFGLKSWEGQLALEGIARQGPSLGTNLWDFTIDRLLPDRNEEELVQKLKRAMEEGTPVIVDYQEKYWQFDFRGDTKYLVRDIRPVGQKKE